MSEELDDLRRRQASAMEAMRRESRRQRAAEARQIGAVVDRATVDAALKRVAAGESCVADSDVLRRYIERIETLLTAYESG